MMLGGLKFNDFELSELMNKKRILPYYFLHILLRCCHCQYYSAGSWHFSSRGDKCMLFVILLKKLDVIVHMRIENVQRDDVMKVDDKHMRKV